MRRLIYAGGLITVATIAFVLNASLSHAHSVHEVQLVATQYAFDPAVIDVTAGEPIRLVIRSGDRVHGFAIRELNIDVQIPRKGNVVVEFTAPRPGRYEIACSEFCGSGHGHMKAALISTAATPTAGR
jgi:cytochrome c oxidase subunit II